MGLYINGEETHKGMKVNTFRGESVTRIDWYEPGTRSGGNGGRVYVEYESGERMEYFPSVVSGTFKN